MKNQVRVESEQNLVTKPSIFLRGPDGEWVDVSPCISAARIDLTVGSIGKASLDLHPVECVVEALRVDEATADAFAECLRSLGWTAEKPEDR